MMRWTPNRKHAIVVDIQEGRVDRSAVMAQHAISEDEMREWERDAERGPTAHRRRRGYQERRR